jgi:hypothetical protein
MHEGMGSDLLTGTSFLWVARLVPEVTSRSRFMSVIKRRMFSVLDGSSSTTGFGVKGSWQGGASWYRNDKQDERVLRSNGPA